MANWKNSSERYGIITIFLHWIMATLIISLLVLGWYITQISYYHPYYHQLLTTHKSLGLLTLVLAVMNSIWYLINPKPTYPPSLKRYEIVAAKSTHLLLLCLMLAVPISGYFISTATGSGIPFFDWFVIGALTPKGHDYAELSGTLHAWLGYSMATLIGLHALAAFKHQWYNKDGLLKRMLKL